MVKRNSFFRHWHWAVRNVISIQKHAVLMKVSYIIATRIRRYSKLLYFFEPGG
ncbi:hypothetical protein K450DRAFT_263952, partial [Umbelopsis ramanniana AG]